MLVSGKAVSLSAREVSRSHNCKLSDRISPIRGGKLVIVSRKLYRHVFWNLELYPIPLKIDYILQSLISDQKPLAGKLKK